MSAARFGQAVLTVFGALLMLGGACFVIGAGAGVLSGFTWQGLLFLALAAAVTAVGVRIIVRNSKA